MTISVSVCSVLNGFPENVSAKLTVAKEIVMLFCEPLTYNKEVSSRGPRIGL